jgi:hypothetical protein
MKPVGNVAAPRAGVDAWTIHIGASNNATMSAQRRRTSPKTLTPTRMAPLPFKP